MATSLSALKKDVEKLKKDVRQIKQTFNILPPVCKVSDWKELHDIDRDILRYMIPKEEQPSFTTGEIAKALGLEKNSGRIKVWKAMKRIRRVGRSKHKYIVSQDRVSKTWSLNRYDYTLLID